MIYLYTGFLLLLSLSIILMPIGSNLKETTMFWFYCSGVTFWMGVIGAGYMAWRINKCRISSSQSNELQADFRRPGVLCFFKNKPAAAADITMFVSAIGFLITRFGMKNNLIPFVFLAVFVFAFGMHCMLNGISYPYIKNEVRREEKL